MSRKKCVIIGSGLGGLACGVILSRNGYDVTVLEQHYQIGGCLQCFSRYGVTFETGMHFIGSADPGQNLYKLMRFLGIDHIPLNRLDVTGYDTVSLSGEQFRFANGKEPFIEQLSTCFPKDKDGLIRYYELVEQVAQASSLRALHHIENDIATITRYQMVSINEVLDDIIKDEYLKNVLVGNLSLYAAEKNKTPFAQHAFIRDFYNQSAFRIVGGSSVIAGIMADEIRQNGGVVQTQQKVTKIVCDEREAKGVEIEGELFLTADVVIADIHPARVMELLDTKLIRPAYRQRIAALRNTPSVFSLYLKFKKDTVPYMNTNFYGYRTQNPWGMEDYIMDNWPQAYLYMHFCHERSPKYAESGVVLTYMDMADVAMWQDTTVGHRGKEYEEFKINKAEKLIAAIEKDFPGFNETIEAYDTASPLTYRDYTGTQDGSIYGVAKDITLGAAWRVPHKTKIHNLFLTGQNINSHGMLGVLVGSMVTCSELLTAETIYHQIMKANER